MQALAAVAASPQVRRAGIYVASALTSALIPFLLLPILARLLGPEGYGKVGAFTGLVAIVSVLVGLSTHGVLTTSYFRVSEQQFRRYFAACIWIVVVNAPTAWLLLLAVGPWLEQATGIESHWYWALAGAAAGQFLLSIALAVFQVRGQAGRFATAQICNSALNLGLTILLVTALARGWEGRAIAQCGATLSVGMLALLLAGGRERPPLSTDRDAVGEVLRFGVPLTPHSLAAAVMSSVDRLVLIALIGPAVSGTYFAAFQIAGVISLMSSAINQAMGPWLFRSLKDRTDATDAKIVRASYAVLAMLMIVGAVVAAMAEPIVYLAGGREFMTAVPLVRVLAIAMTLNGAYYLFANYIFYAHRTHWLSIATVSVSLLQVGLVIVMARWHGAMGAAWASVIVNAVYVGLVWTIAAKLVPMPWFRRRVSP